MSRPFNFSWATQQEARRRQGGVCAHCGEDLTDLLEHAHHVVPNQSGAADNPQHQWLKGANNCVVLCDQCHYRVHHDGRFRTGAVAPPDYFSHSHGSNEPAHQAWVKHLRVLTQSVWP